MQLYLQQIAAITEPDQHAVVIMDGAGWHTNDIATGFDNVSIIKLPPHSLELNSIEQVWGSIRQYCLTNRVFTHYEDIVDSVCAAWNIFTESAERVPQI